MPQFHPISLSLPCIKIAVICGIAVAHTQSCKIWDNVALAIDTMFQFSYVASDHHLESSSNCVFLGYSNPFLTWPIESLFLLFGLTPAILNVAVPNPSIFPDFRLLHNSPLSPIVALLPCLRAFFDAWPNNQVQKFGTTFERKKHHASRVTLRR
ncbi:hypothetical protein C8R44DRAFT_799701 [Mycena epipterygia]|nr:hypothetical protein C8R44DRAFT_799701 [Mycena epipterygia]